MILDRLGVLTDEVSADLQEALDWKHPQDLLGKIPHTYNGGK